MLFVVLCQLLYFCMVCEYSYFCFFFMLCVFFFFFNDTATTEIYTLSLHDALRSEQLLAVLKKVIR